MPEITTQQIRSIEYSKGSGCSGDLECPVCSSVRHLVPQNEAAHQKEWKWKWTDEPHKLECWIGQFLAKGKS